MADSPFAVTPTNPNIPTNTAPTNPAPDTAPTTNPNVVTQNQVSPTLNPVAPAANTVAPTDANNTDIDALLASLSTPESVEAPTPMQPPVEAPAPAGPQPINQPPVPQSMDWQQQQYVQQILQQNAELQQKIQSQDATINNLLATQKDYDALKQRADVNNIDFGELASVDQEDAKKISAGIMKALSGPLAAIQQAIQQQQQYVTQSNKWQEQRFNQQQAYDTINRIKATHPDFIELQSDPAYLQFVGQRDGHSFQTRDARAAFEFQNGNADYIIDLINQFKQSRPQSNSIVSVSPVQTATAVPQPAPSKPALPTISELNTLYQTHRISADQYRQILTKYPEIRNRSQG